MKILLVEDQRQLGQILKRHFGHEGYVVTWVRRYAAAQEAYCNAKPDVIILDLTLPDGDGLDLLRQWRKAGAKTPVLILSARNSVQDRVDGLDIGADDYLPKPFSVNELTARVRSLMRRKDLDRATIYEHRGIRLDLLERTVTYRGNPITLSAREFALLEVFVKNAGRVLTRTMLREKVWETNYGVYDALLDVYMSRLRLKFDHPSDQPLFCTIRGVGYQLLP